MSSPGSLGAGREGRGEGAKEGAKGGKERRGERGRKGGEGEKGEKTLKAALLESRGLGKRGQGCRRQYGLVG